MSIFWGKAARSINHIISVLFCIISICCFSYFPFGLEETILVLIVPVPNHCLFFFYFWYEIFLYLLAHLSRRLKGELIGYSWSGVRPSVVNNFKHLLQNRLPDQSQNLCGASLGRGNQSLFATSGSHDQDGRHAHIW